MALKRVSDLARRKFDDIREELDKIYEDNGKSHIPFSKIQVSEALNDDSTQFKSYAYDLNAISGIVTDQMFNRDVTLNGKKTFNGCVELSDVSIGGTIKAVTINDIHLSTSSTLSLDSKNNGLISIDGNGISSVTEKNINIYAEKGITTLSNGNVITKGKDIILSGSLSGNGTSAILNYETDIILSCNQTKVGISNNKIDISTQSLNLGNGFYVKKDIDNLSIGVASGNNISGLSVSKHGNTYANTPESNSDDTSIVTTKWFNDKLNKILTEEIKKQLLANLSITAPLNKTHREELSDLITTGEEKERILSINNDGYICGSFYNTTITGNKTYHIILYSVDNKKNYKDLFQIYLPDNDRSYTSFLILMYVKKDTCFRYLISSESTCLCFTNWTASGGIFYD